ncbi:adenylosuccinate lyase [Colletotrichum incanum]|nr:adenylosuccinate lyase [Colletotrichum incanum]
MPDLHSTEQVLSELKLRGAQVTSGTQASFFENLEGDSAKCDKLKELLCENFGFQAYYEVSTQTYTRKVDLIIANAVVGLGFSAQKITGDICYLAHWKEIEEPFEFSQIGSPAMMRSERIYNLARELLSKPAIFTNTHADQWESVLMRLRAQGASRQEAHGQIRVLSNEAGSVLKYESY